MKHWHYWHKRISIFALAAFIGIGMSGCKKDGADLQGKNVSLTYYTVSGEQGDFANIISAYRKKNPNVSIIVKSFDDPDFYEDQLINEMAEGTGPDLFDMHNTWMPRHMKKVTPLVSESLPPAQFRQEFVGVAADDFVKKGADGAEKIYGIPLYVDTLAVFYNKDDYESVLPEQGGPAATWSDFENDVFRLTEEDPDEENGFDNSGTALGTSATVSHAVDVLYGLMMEDGITDMAEVSRARKSLELYASFADSKRKNYSWNDGAGSDVQEFLDEDVSTIFGYSDLIPQLADVNFGVAKFPQQDEDAPLYLANYYAMTVSRASKNALWAWDFAYFAAQKDQAQEFLGKTGKPTARRDLIETQRNDAKLGVFVSQLGTAKTPQVYNWSRFESLYREAMSAVENGGQSASNALQSVQQKISKIVPKK